MRTVIEDLSGVIRGLLPHGINCQISIADGPLEVEVDRREAFLGEQVTATVWLLSPVGVAQYEAYRPPPLDGFWVEELERPRQLDFRVRSRNGVPVRAYLVQRLALFPTRAGEPWYASAAGGAPAGKG